MIGSPWYRKKPPTENVMAEIARLVGVSACLLSFFLGIILRG